MLPTCPMESSAAPSGPRARRRPSPAPTDPPHAPAPPPPRPPQADSSTSVTEPYSPRTEVEKSRTTPWVLRVVRSTVRSAPGPTQPAADALSPWTSSSAVNWARSGRPGWPTGWSRRDQHHEASGGIPEEAQRRGGTLRRRRRPQGSPESGGGSGRGTYGSCRTARPTGATCSGGDRPGPSTSSARPPVRTVFRCPSSSSRSRDPGGCGRSAPHRLTSRQFPAPPPRRRIGVHGLQGGESTTSTASDERRNRRRYRVSICRSFQ